MISVFTLQPFSPTIIASQFGNMIIPLHVGNLKLKTFYNVVSRNTFNIMFNY